MTDWTLMDWIGTALSAAAAFVWIREVAQLMRPKVVLSHTRYEWRIECLFCLRRFK